LSGRVTLGAQVEAGGDRHATTDGAGDRAAVGVEAEHPLDRRPLRLVGDQQIGDMDAFDDQDLGVQLDLADRVCLETTVSCRDAARLQRAPEGPGQSPSGRGHQIVQGGGVRLLLGQVGAVVLGHRAMNAEGDRLVFGWHHGGSQGTLVPGDADVGAVDDLAHRYCDLLGGGDGRTRIQVGVVRLAAHPSLFPADGTPIPVAAGR
jgi:hypothetical protein